MIRGTIHVDVIETLRGTTDRGRGPGSDLRRARQRLRQRRPRDGPDRRQPRQRHYGGRRGHSGDAAKHGGSDTTASRRHGANREPTTVTATRGSAGPGRRPRAAGSDPGQRAIAVGSARPERLDRVHDAHRRTSRRAPRDRLDGSASRGGGRRRLAETSSTAPGQCSWRRATNARGPGPTPSGGSATPDGGAARRSHGEGHRTRDELRTVVHGIPQGPSRGSK